MMKFIGFGLLGLLACGGELADEAPEFEEIAQIEQPVVAACLKDNGNVQYGVQDTQSPWTRCDPSANIQCLLPGIKQTYEMAMTTGWSAGDKLEWGIGGTNAANFMRQQFTAWLGLATIPHYRFNVNNFDTAIPAFPETASDLGLYLPNYIEFRKQSLAEPSWYANRANTTNALFTDLVRVQCLTRIALTDSTTSSWSKCSKWAAKVDYDRIRGWATARNFNVQNLIEATVKKTMAWTMGLAPGSGSGLTITDPKLYVTGSSTNPTTWVNASFGSEQSWVNNYMLTGEGQNATVDACIRNCGFDSQCVNNCKNTLHCVLE